MIRDPSDGSVKEIPSKEINLQVNKINVVVPETASKEITPMVSGLPPEKAKQAERLKESRNWLKDYFNRRAEQTDPGLRSSDSGEG